MKPEDLMGYICQIDDQIIAEADISLSNNKPVAQISEGGNLLDGMRRNLAKWFAPAALGLAAVIVMAFVLPNLPGTKPHDPGTIISENTRDSFDLDAAANAPDLRPAAVGGAPDYISPMLQDAVNSAKAGELITTIVLVPGFYEYRDAFEVDGVTYFELWQYAGSGVWKEGVPPEHEWEKAKFDANPGEYVQNMGGRLSNMEEMAFAAFQAKTVAELNIKVGVMAIVQDAEYHYGAFTFIANLSPEQIKSLEREGCFMKLWSPVEELAPESQNRGAD